MDCLCSLLNISKSCHCILYIFCQDRMVIAYCVQWYIPTQAGLTQSWRKTCVCTQQLKESLPPQSEQCLLPPGFASRDWIKSTLFLYIRRLSLVDKFGDNNQKKNSIFNQFIHSTSEFFLKCHNEAITDSKKY